MRKIKILDLYGEALGLTGDRKNIRAFEARLAEMGHEYETSCLGLGDEISFADYDVIFMTHGKPHIVAALAKDFVKYKEQLLAFIESGKTFVATGFAEALLYKSFKMLDGVTYEGIGLIDAEAEEFDGLYVSDALLAPAFAPEERVFGTYYNFAKVSYNKNESPLFEVLKADAGEGAVSGTEGFCYKNLFATRCLGPLFVRNPNMMKKLLKTVLGPDYAETDFSLEEKAQAKLIEEMK